MDNLEKSADLAKSIQSLKLEKLANLISVKSVKIDKIVQFCKIDLIGKIRRFSEVKLVNR